MIPVDNSDIATKLAMNGDRLKYSVRPSGGKGNLPKPYNINAIPTPSLNKRDPKASKFEKKLLKFKNNLFILIDLNYFQLLYKLIYL